MTAEAALKAARRYCALRAWAPILAALAALAAALTPGFATSAAPAPSAGGAAATKAAVEGLALQSLYLIEAARIAQRRGRSPATRKVARALLMQARDAYRRIENPALAAAVRLPTSVDFKRRQSLRALEASSSDRFDRLFAVQQLNAAKTAAVIAAAYAHSGKSSYMRAYSEAAQAHIKGEIAQLEQLTEAAR